jgi:hypothetical protein
MKYFLVGLAVWFAVAWLPHFIKAWVRDIRIWWAKRHAGRNDQWMYE